MEGDGRHPLLARGLTGFPAISPIATFATRGRDKLVLLRAVGGGLLMHALYYAEEVRSFADLDLGAGTDVREGELAYRMIGELAAS